MRFASNNTTLSVLSPDAVIPLNPVGRVVWATGVLGTKRTLLRSEIRPADQLAVERGREGEPFPRSATGLVNMMSLIRPAVKRCAVGVYCVFPPLIGIKKPHSGFIDQTCVSHSRSLRIDCIARTDPRVLHLRCAPLASPVEREERRNPITEAIISVSL